MFQDSYRVESRLESIQAQLKTIEACAELGSISDYIGVLQRHPDFKNKQPRELVAEAVRLRLEAEQIARGISEQVRNEVWQRRNQLELWLPRTQAACLITQIKRPKTAIERLEWFIEYIVGPNRLMDHETQQRILPQYMRIKQNPNFWHQEFCLWLQPYYRKWWELHRKQTAAREKGKKPSS
jgi:hypothetical protein